MIVLNFAFLRHKGESNPGSYWNCLCDCGNVAIKHGGSLTFGSIQSCGCLLNEHHQRDQSREKHPNWRFDLTEEERMLQKSRNYLPELVEWKKKILSRDNYTCQISLLKCSELAVHHIYNWADNKSKRFDIDNGIVMSKQLHILFHTLFKQRHNNPKQLEIFKKQYIEGKLNKLLEYKSELKQLDRQLKKSQQELEILTQQ